MRLLLSQAGGLSLLGLIRSDGCASEIEEVKLIEQAVRGLDEKIHLIVITRPLLNPITINMEINTPDIKPLNFS